LQRSIVYDQEQLDPFDVLWQYKDVLIAIGALELDLAGQTTTMVTGFSPTPTAPASLSINLTSGRIYQQSVMDSTAYGALASDSTVVQQQGAAPAQSVTLSTAGLSSGQSMWALVQAQFSQVDVVRTGDPTGGVLNYWNASNPTQPFQGPNNDGSSQPTERKATVSIQVIYGTPASSGSEVPPNPTNGWVPLFLVDLAFAQTTITSGQILVAGPSVGANVPNNYPGAPFLAGLLNQHHKGTAGQAPQIDLTSEVKNILPLLNLLASSTSGGGLPVLKLHAGNPNGNVAGNFNVNGASDFCIDTTNQLLYFCSATGTSSTAVWTSVSGATTSIFAGGTATGTVNAQIVASTSPSGFTKSPGQVVTFTGLNNTNSTTLNVDGTGASTVQKNSGGSDVNLTGGELNGFVTVVWTGSIYLLQPGLLGQLSTMNLGKWVKNDGSNNLTLNVDPSLQDNGGGELQVTPSYLPPSGALMPYAGTTAPSGWLLAQGQPVPRTGSTANLFAVCGITYGSGDGVTTFNLPDLRGRVVAGVDGGVGRLTTNTMSSQALGGTGGSETETLTLSQIPTGIQSANGSQAITVYPGGNSGVFAPTSGGGAFGLEPAPTTSGNQVIVATGGVGSLTNQNSFSAPNSISVTSDNTGGAPHPNVQPTIELNYIIKL
jgi:microcystin-dependent protein